MAVSWILIYAGALIILLRLPTDLAVLMPGPTLDARSTLVPRAEKLPGEGRLLVTTVAAAPRANVVNLIQAILTPAASALPSDLLLPAELTLSEYQAIGQRQMAESKAAARAAAFRHAGIDAHLSGPGAEISTPLSPVAPDIQVGDIDDVIGPSAGLMLALAVLDRLSPEPLTRGRSVAGTGTITPTGVVGPVGGVAQKAVGAEQAGAEYFLVPLDNYREAAHAARGMMVVPVGSLEEAVRFLGSLQPGNPVGEDQQPTKLMADR